VSKTLIFGAPEPGVQYAERRAAYVVITDAGRVAVVEEAGKHYLPGGGAEGSETPEETVRREVHEELARGVRLIQKMGEVVQYFYSASDKRHYRMAAVFFTGELTDEECGGVAELELSWLARAEAEAICFHECHAWAIRQARKGGAGPPG
jgi:8-oxo-dGTP diphosphatase